MNISQTMAGAWNTVSTNASSIAHSAQKLASAAWQSTLAKASAVWASAQPKLAALFSSIKAGVVSAKSYVATQAPIAYKTATTAMASHPVITLVAGFAIGAAALHLATRNVENASA